MFKESILITILISLGILIFVIVIGFIHYQRSEKESTSTDWKTYRNEEWGFEFEYPEGWSIHKNAFSGPFSKFNLIGTSPEETVPNTIIPSFLVNIVTPDFADRAFYDLKNIASDITVSGVAGLKYEYDFEGFPQIAIDLPFGKYHLILGANKEYKNVFDQIVATFKFLK